VLALTLAGCNLGLTELKPVESDTGTLDATGGDQDGDLGDATDTGFTGGSGSDGGSDGGSGSGSGSDGGSDGGSGSGSGSDGGSDGGSGSGSGSDGGSDSGGDSGSSGPVDADGDGFTTETDCDDSNPAVNPSAGEYCDGIDNDCDGRLDADDGDLIDGFTAYYDGDGDGWGSSTTATVCSATGGYVTTTGDCNDSVSSISPSATEVCDDGIDNDCDGGIDDGATCDYNYVGLLVWWAGVGAYYPGDYNCQIVWDTWGERSSASCPGCDFVLDVDATINTTYTWSDGLCSYSDFTGTWAWDSDYSGRTGYVLVNSYGTWYPITSNASYSTSSGLWIFGSGYLDYAYSYGWSTYYYTNYEYGYGYVY
jgi:hypothetical protein